MSSTYPKKIYLELDKPSVNDFRADKERIKEALYPLEVSFSVEVLNMLYPLCQNSDYKVTVTLSPNDFGFDVVRIEPGNTTDQFYGLALDIGSTTLEMEIIDLNSGESIVNTGCVNSQVKFGLNILDRIIAVKADRNNGKELQSLVVGDINRLLSEALDKTGLKKEDISMLNVGGNTTMIHFLYGCDPWLVFQNPYAPCFFDPGIHRCSDIGIELNCNIFCMPAIANYLGGDITSGLLLTDIEKSDTPVIFLDIGTNGELALGCKDFLLVGAGAAGPALEGFGSASGMRAETGAVRHLKINDDDTIELEVIGNVKPKGICGTGIFDLVAQGYLAGWIESSGKVNTDMKEHVIIVKNVESEKDVPAIVYYQDEETTLYFTQDDILEFIRCKAAAHTMVATLLGESGITLNDVSSIYLAGGFGTHIDIESAITVGIYPDVERSKLKILGNSSLIGAKRLLVDESLMSRVKDLLNRAVYVQFAEMDKFVENMVAAQFIPHTDHNLYPSVKPRR